MKIVSFKTYHIKPRWLFLKIETDEGICGYGEPVVEGKSKAVEALLKTFEKILIGMDPLMIEHIWQKLYRGGFYRGGPIWMSAISGIEQALWDIKGKYYNMPVYEMLGGRVRNKIKMYPHLSGDERRLNDSSADNWVELAKIRKKQGFKAIKVCLDGPLDYAETPKKYFGFVDKMERMREELGEDYAIAIDFHGRASLSLSKQLCRALEPINPMFVEEPVLPENIDGLKDISSFTSIPIATGERIFGKWEYAKLLEKEAVAIIQPDACHAGGIFEIRKIAAMAEAYHVAVAPHNPLGPISLAACLQIDACIPNFVIQEHPSMDTKLDIGKDILIKPFEVKDGYIEIPKGPGLGIVVNEDALENLIYDGDWTNPNFVDPIDGSIRDW